MNPAIDTRPSRPDLLLFGRFELDLRARELRHGGRRIRLQRQPFEVLVALLERTDDVCTREELHRILWRDGIFVDFEHGLNAAVRRLRRALGDTAIAPRYIETIHGVGYRFLTPVAIGASSVRRSPYPILGSRNRTRMLDTSRV